jgi:hypothetical protein
LLPIQSTHPNGSASTGRSPRAKARVPVVWARPV